MADSIHRSVTGQVAFMALVQIVATMAYEQQSDSLSAVLANLEPDGITLSPIDLAVLEEWGRHWPTPCTSERDALSRTLAFFEVVKEWSGLPRDLQIDGNELERQFITLSESVRDGELLTFRPSGAGLVRLIQGVATEKMVVVVGSCVADEFYAKEDQAEDSCTYSRLPLNLLDVALNAREAFQVFRFALGHHSWTYQSLDSAALEMECIPRGGTSVNPAILSSWIAEWGNLDKSVPISRVADVARLTLARLNFAPQYREQLFSIILNNEWR